MDARRRRFLDQITEHGIVSFDTNACIYYLGREEPFFSLLAPLVARAAAGSLRIVLSAIVRLELLVKPYRLADQRLVRQALDFTEGHLGIDTSEISREVIDGAAQVRALLGLKAPEAIVVAAAALSGAGVVVGNDRTFGRLNDANVKLAIGTQVYGVPAFVRLDEYS